MVAKAESAAFSDMFKCGGDAPQKGDLAPDEASGLRNCWFLKARIQKPPPHPSSKVQEGSRQGWVGGSTCVHEKQEPRLSKLRQTIYTYAICRTQVGVDI